MPVGAMEAGSELLGSIAGPAAEVPEVWCVWARKAGRRRSWGRGARGEAEPLWALLDLQNRTCAFLGGSLETLHGRDGSLERQLERRHVRATQIRKAFSRGCVHGKQRTHSKTTGGTWAEWSKHKSTENTEQMLSSSMKKTVEYWAFKRRWLRL